MPPARLATREAGGQGGRLCPGQGAAAAAGELSPCGYWADSGHHIRYGAENDSHSRSQGLACLLSGVD